jgi:predicted component of type VI protein secretion system
MKLVIEDEAGTRSIVPFAEDVIVVGRAPEVTFRLPDRNVSRRHARFVRQSGSVFVEDLGSLTGTRVNGERITGRRRLRDGDLVQIGDYDLALLDADAAREPLAPPPLPTPARGDPRPRVVEHPAELEPTPAETAAPAAPSEPPPGRGRTLRRAILVGAVALAVGLAAGWAVGTFGGPGASAARTAVTRP